MNWLFRGILALILVYVVLCGSVAIAMMQTPERFGAFMKRMPAPVVWGATPARRMWLWARRGDLAVGDPAPDFDLRTTQDRARRVSLSSYRGDRPVVLVFGSYT
jgi:hypothetical protein